MIRWSGLLALAAAAALVGLLLHRTRSAELVGKVTDPLRGGTWEHPQNPPSSGRRPLYITVPKPGRPIEEEIDSLVLAGFSMCGWEEGSTEDSLLWAWQLEVPEEVAVSTRPRDDVLIQSRSLYLPGAEGDGICFCSYTFRRGPRSWSFPEWSNGKFFLVYALAGGAPILIWAIIVGVALLRRRNGTELEATA